jgi:hypothetical protein
MSDDEVVVDDGTPYPDDFEPSDEEVTETITVSVVEGPGE